MRYVASDIHGEYDLFLRLLEKIGFTDEDEMIICGDIIDKGKKSVQLLRHVRSCSNIKCIMGNHEHAFVSYYRFILREEFEGEEAALKRLRESLVGDGELLLWDDVDWLESLPYYYEDEDMICVHAGLPLDDGGAPVRLSEIKQGTQEMELLIHDRRFKNPEFLHNGDKCVFFGHTATGYICGEDRILLYPREGNIGGVRGLNKVHLDLNTWNSGVLGCICTDDLSCHYVGGKY